MLAPKISPNGVGEIDDFHFGAILAPSWGGLGIILALSEGLGDIWVPFWLQVRGSGGHFASKWRVWERLGSHFASKLGAQTSNLDPKLPKGLTFLALC